MKFHNTKVFSKVREKRSKGVSITKLAKEFKISESSISRWVRDIKSDSKAFLAARLFESNSKNKFHPLVDKIKISDDISRVLTAILYWCEGSKYPASNFVAFSNSDSALVKVFLGLFRKSFDIDERKLRVHLQLHDTHNKKVTTKFWSNLLGVNIDKFHKPTITSPGKKMKRRDYMGTCTIKYFDVRLLLNIMGIYEKMIPKLWRRG